MSKFKKGVLFGKDVQDVFTDAKKNNYALPAVNVTNTSTVNSVLETSVKLNSPSIIQFSNGGCVFFAGKGLSNINQQATRTVFVTGEPTDVRVVLAKPKS